MNVQSRNATSVPCWNQVPDKHAVGNLVFSFHSGSSFRQSCSQEVDVRFSFKIKLLTITQSGIGCSEVARTA